jgi:glycosidase
MLHNTKNSEVKKDIMNSRVDIQNFLASECAASIRAAIQALLKKRPVELDSVLKAIQASVVAEEPGMAHERKLISLINHMLYLLSDEEEIFSNCTYERDSWLNLTLRCERVARGNDGFKKIVVRISDGAVASDIRAFDQFTLGPSIQIYKNDVTVRPVHNKRHFPDVDFDLDENELLEFFQNKKNILQRIHQGSNTADGEGRKYMRAQNERDRDNIKAVWREMHDSGHQFAANRATHPYRRALLHVLPRLLRGTTGDSTLHTMSATIPALQSMGFGGLMLGVTDRQSTCVYYGEFDDGTLIPYVNNHGYWSSGETGIDPLLGTADEYAALVAALRQQGMDFTQDSIYGTLGYPPQVARFAMSDMASPVSSVVLGAHEVSVSDSRLFLHEPCIHEEDSLVDGVDEDQYTTVVAQSHLGSPFALPKPNVFYPEVLADTLKRSIWQIKNAGVASFRIDMAKHMGIEQLRATIGQLRQEIDVSPGQAFSVLLEYWSVKYRDLKFASTALADQRAGAYFFDFPLAHALQEVLIRKKPVIDCIGKLLTDRKKWRMPDCQLVPVFIDHDFNFRPIYNGNYETRAIVVAGYAMTLMLSANAPYVYFGYQNAEAGVPELSEYWQYSEEHSRKMCDEIFRSGDPASPAQPLADMLKVFEKHQIQQNWCEGDIAYSGTAEHLIIVRQYTGARDGRIRELRAIFSRCYQEPQASPEYELLYDYRHGPSIVIEQRFVKQ